MAKERLLGKLKFQHVRESMPTEEFSEPGWRLLALPRVLRDLRRGWSGFLPLLCTCSSSGHRPGRLPATMSWRILREWVYPSISLTGFENIFHSIRTKIFGRFQIRRTVRVYLARRTAPVARTGRINAPVASITWLCMKTSVTRRVLCTPTRLKITTALRVILPAKLAMAPLKITASRVGRACFLWTVCTYTHSSAR